MIVELPALWVIALNVLGWLAIQTGMAWLFTKLPARFFKARAVPKSERNFYRRVLFVKKWKRLLPDAARMFAGGFAKGTLNQRDAAYLRQFARETRRGELCHWAALAFAPLFFVWNPLWAGFVNLAYALLANAPCIIALRFNRARLGRSFPRPRGKQRL